MSKIKTKRWDSAEHLKTDEDMVAYIDACLEEAGDDAAFIAHALGVVARAKGMTQLANETGLGRESLYKALSGEGNPSFATILKVMRALGVKLQAEATVRSLVRERYAIWIDIYAEIESRVREVQHNRLFHVDGLQHLLVMALFSRTVSNTSAAMLVAEHGYEVQCKALLRPALESMFALAAITKDPRMAEAYAQAGERELKRRVFKSRLWSQDLRSPLESRFGGEAFKKAEDVAKSTKAKKISTEEMAKVAGLHDWYLTAYTLYSDAVHGNIHDLEQQFVRSEDGEIEGVRSGAIVANLHGLYLCASEILLKGLEAIDDVFQVDTREFRTHMMERLATAVNEQSEYLTP